MAADNRLKQAPALAPSFSGGDLVSTGDRDDLRRIRIDGRSSLDISLTNLKRKTNADLELYLLKNASALKKIGNLDFSRLSSRQRNQGLTLVASSTKGSNASESINQNLSTGDYYLRVRYRSGKGRVTYQMSGTVNPDNAGEGLGDARSIATDGTRYSDFVGASDPSDFYQFVAPAGNTTIAIDGLTGDANLALLDTSGIQIGTSTATGTTADSITQSLDPGATYFVRVAPAGGAGSNYQIRVSSTSDGTPPPGITPPGTPPPGTPPPGTMPDGNDTLGTATPITVDFEPRSRTDAVGDGDSSDYYSFTLTADSTFDLSLTGLQADANIELLNADGSLYTQSANGGVQDESISITPNNPGDPNPLPRLTAGSYFIRVFQGATGQNTPYSMNFSAVPAIDLAGNDPANARDITTDLVTSSITKPTQYQEFVGGKDTNDYYKFIVPDGGSFLSTKLDILGSGTNVDLDVKLLKDNGTANPDLITSSISAGNADEAFGGNLGAGTYYLQIFPSQQPTPQGSVYNLSVYTRPAKGQPTIARDINPGEGSSSPGQLTSVGNNKVFFTANDGTGDSLWLADGSTDQTNLGTLQSIKKTQLGTNLSGFNNLTSGKFGGNDVLYFTASSGGTGDSLWRTDGTATGTQLIQNIASIGALSEKPVVVNDTLYYVVQAIGRDDTLWRSNGTPEGTAPIGAGFFEGRITNLTAIGTTLYFSATDGTPTGLGEELWRITSPTSNPEEIDVRTGQAGSSPKDFFAFNNAVYFVAIGSTPTTFDTGFELWKLDNGSSTPTLVRDLLPGDYNSSFSGAPNFTAFNNELYFTANGPTGAGSTTTGRELWKLTSAGTMTLVADLNTSGVGEASSDPSNLTVVGSGTSAALYFSADAASDDPNIGKGSQLWKYTGVGSPTAIDLRTDTTQPRSGYDPQQLVNVAGTLYFRANVANGTADIGNELWSIAADGVKKSFDILPGVNSSSPSGLTEVLGRLFFVANNGLNDATGTTPIVGNGSELWVIG